MAAPFLSTVAPNPLNPDRTIDRRRLLIGGTALAAAAPVIAFGHPPASRVPPSPFKGEGWGEGALKKDPALAVFRQLCEIDRAIWDTVANEDDPYYRGLCAAYDAAEARFAETRALSPAGVRAKLDHLAKICGWEAEDILGDGPLAASIVEDFAHVIAGRAGAAAVS